MTNVIHQTIELFNKFIGSTENRSLVSTQYSHLLGLDDDLNKLLEKDLLNDVLPHLFCRRLEKLTNRMPNHTKWQCEIWTDIQDDLLYILNGPDVTEDKQKWERFLARMILEGQLEQRELQFHMTVDKQKSFLDLLSVHQIIIQEYLAQCISLHSKVQVRNLINNVDELLSCTYKQREVRLTTEQRSRLEDRLKCIEINFDSSKICTLERDPETSPYETFNKNTTKNVSQFLPTVLRTTPVSFVSTHDISALKSNQWTVILGKQHCGKTTLLRWITRTYAETILSKNDQNIFRIPILIRIDEFAQWLEHHPTLTLIDYIGKHTWFTQLYHHHDQDNLRNVLKEFIYHGYALILLDGLNDISIFTQRSKIVDHIKNFIDNYITTSNYFSPFDESFFGSRTLSRCYDTYFQERSGNQIILTSRFVGYELCTFHSPFIKHLSLKEMKWELVIRFAYEWVKQVEQNIRIILLDEGFPLDESGQRTLINRLDDIINLIYISDKPHMSPHLITLFCLHIFTLSNKSSPKSPIELYNYPVQLILRSWTNLESTLSEKIVFEFLIELATHIYLHSSSDLIDEFDMKKLCYLVLQRCHLANNRQELETYTNKMLGLFNSNLSLIAKQGLEVFSFIHVSFQRYFAVQALVRDTSIENIVQQFSKFLNQRRLYVSLLMAIGWMSSQWSLDKYNGFCHRLISSDAEWALPLGSLLFLDALKYLHNLPLKTVLFQALNHLLEHPSKLLAQKYLTASELPIEIIVEWMQLNITNEKLLTKFCLCLLHSESIFYIKNDEESLKNASPYLFQQLWLLRKLSPTAELIIDQTLQKIMKFDERPDQIFDNQLSRYLLTQKRSSWNIHPLIFSVILSLCGGLHFVGDEQGNEKVRFSPSTMHRPSVVIESLMEYFLDNQQSHSVKLQNLIEKYENILDKTTPNDTSVDIIDTFIALICLRGVSDPSIYAKFSQYDALPFVLQRFKQISVDLRSYYKLCYNLNRRKCTLIFKIESILNEYFCLLHHSNEQFIQFSFACISAWKQLGLHWLSYFSNSNSIQKSNIYPNLDVQFEYRHYLTSQKQQQSIESTPLDLLIFIPKSLQPLYYRLFISTIDQNESLPVIILLSECLIRLDNNRFVGMDYTRIFLRLYPLCEKHKLENYVSVLLWKDPSKSQSRQEVFDRLFINVTDNFELLIDQERERIRLARSLDGHEKDLQLFASCLCLTRLLQVHSRSVRTCTSMNSEEIYNLVESISDEKLQLILWNLILRLTKTMIFTDEQVSQFNRKINTFLINLPLLTLTYFFIQDYQKCRFNPNLIRNIGEKFTQNSPNKQIQDCVYTALRILNDTNLSSYLTIYEKQTRNISNILQFNSTTFFDYFSENPSFNSSDLILLSSMYLSELSKDIQILEMYTKKDLTAKEFDRLWLDSFKSQQIMTVEFANWITNYLKSFNRESIDEVIQCLSSCCFVEEQTDEIIVKWFEYRTDEQLKIFAYYAALFCIGENSREILNEMFDSGSYLLLKGILKNRLELKSVTPSLLSNILIPIIHGAYRHSMQTSANIHSKDILDALLDIKQNRSYLSIVHSCSENLKHYLIQHLENFAKNEQYLLEIIKLIILDNLSLELYECLMIFLHDQQFPLIQIALMNCINQILIDDKIDRRYIFFTNDLKKQLEDLMIKTNLNREDLLALCLLAYGNCLLRLNAFKMNHIVSNEIQNFLQEISVQSTSKIVSTRALICFILSKNEQEQYQLTSTWIQTNFNLPIENRYNALLQLTIYKDYNLNYQVLNELITYIQAYPSILMNKFLRESYEGFCNKDSLLQYLPNYVQINRGLLKSNPHMFFDALQQTSFGEGKFQSALCQACKRYGDIAYLYLFIDLGEITDEFVEMLRCIGEKYESDFPSLEQHLAKIKNVVNYDIIEDLFELFRVKFRSKSTVSIRILELLVYLTQQGFVSPLDVHQQVSKVTNHQFYEYD